MEISEANFLTKLGVHIRQLREKQDMSQQDLAIDSDIPKSQIGRIERAEINTTVATLLKISKALKIPFVELFGFLKQT